MYFVDLVAVTLVSCIVIMAGFCAISRCKLGRVVFSVVVCCIGVLRVWWGSIVELWGV